MKKLVFSVVLAVFLVFFGAQASFAESVVVKHDVVFIADGGLVVKNLNHEDLSSCLPDTSAADNPVDLSTASDVIIRKRKSDVVGYDAVVTTHPPRPDMPDETMIDFEVVDVTTCFPEEVVNPVMVESCYASLDGDTLHVPCIVFGEDVISANFTQNGGSQNWKAHGIFKNETVSGHFHNSDEFDENNP